MDLRLAIFDCDGTLADSEASIFDSVAAAFAEHGLAAPAREEILARVGLSLGDFFADVAPGLDAGAERAVVDSYRRHFARIREERGADPVFPGLLEILDELTGRGVLLGIATGKSRRGLARFLEAHDLTHRFATLQTADDAPSKPHPAMIERALEETGSEASGAVMIGDTTFDVEAAVNAGVRAIGVTWGHHDAGRLSAAGAAAIATDPARLRELILG